MQNLYLIQRQDASGPWFDEQAFDSGDKVLDHIRGNTDHLHSIRQISNDPLSSPGFRGSGLWVDVTKTFARLLATEWKWEFDSEGDPVTQPPTFIADYVTPARDVWAGLEPFEVPYLQSEMR